MEKHKRLMTGATAAAFLLIGTFAVAQAAATARTLKPSERRASGMAQRKDGAVVHSDYSRPVDPRKKGNMGGIDGGSNAAAHAAARSKAPNNAPDKSRTGENPMYEQSGKSGTNALHKSNDQLKAKAGTPNSQPAPKTAADTSRKHLAGVKYQNRTSAGQQSNKRSSTENFKQDFGQVQATKR